MKKRFLSILLTLALVLSMFSMVTVGASAKTDMEVVPNYEYSDSNDTIIDNELFTYAVEDSRAIIVRCHAEELPANYTVPTMINGHEVFAINEDAYSGVWGMQTLTIPDCIELIDKNAFYGTEIETVYIGSGVKEIGDAAFAGAINLSTIVVDPDNDYFVVEDEVLYTKDMTKLVQCPPTKYGSEFIFPETVTIIGDSAFELSNLESVVIPDTIIEIDDYAFYDSMFLTEAIIGNNVQIIGEGAFEFTALENITIPASVKTIGAWAFADIYTLTAINVVPSNENYCSENGILFSKDMKELVAYPEGKTASTYKVPASVTTLKEGCFNCAPFESVMILESVVNFEYGVFFDAGELVILCYKNSEADKYANENDLHVEYIVAKSLKLNAATIKWPVGKAGHFKPTVLPAEASQVLEWTSSNPAVATVNANGKLTAVSAGTTTITCKTTDGSNLKATCKVTVTVPNPVTSLKLNASTINWPVGKAGHFKPTVLPDTAANKTLSWTSSNSSVATVDANGKLTAVSVGTAVITCKTTDGTNLSATCRVTVKGNTATSLKLNATKINWPVGKAGHFKPTVLPAEHANQKLEWTSSNPAVATVNENGKLTAVASGTAIITCKTTDGSNLSATCTVTIGKLVTSLKLNATKITWPIGKSGSFKPTVSPSDASNKTLSWTSSNPSVATVSASGKLTAVAPGTTTITCKTTDGSNKTATCTVTVTGIKVTSLKLNATNIVWEVGKSGSFKPTVAPSNATNKTLSWTSSNPSVATVSASGKLTAVAPGTTTITCKTTDGSNLKATCKVTVKGLNPEKVLINYVIDEGLYVEEENAYVITDDTFYDEYGSLTFIMYFVETGKIAFASSVDYDTGLVMMDYTYGQREQDVMMTITYEDDYDYYENIGIGWIYADKISDGNQIIYDFEFDGMHPSLADSFEETMGSTIVAMLMTVDLNLDVADIGITIESLGFTNLYND